MPQINIKQLTEADDIKLLTLVAIQMKFQGKADEVLKHFQENKGNLQQIDWKKIDSKLGVEPYQSKARSHNRFFSVLIPNALPEYDLTKRNAISDYIIKRLEEDKETWQNYNEKERVQYRKDLEKKVKKEYNLSADDLFSFKKQVDKNRHQMINIMKKSPQTRTETESAPQSQSAESEDGFQNTIFTDEGSQLQQIQQPPQIQYASMQCDYEMSCFSCLFTSNE
ncbi:Hypothetical_protein [Hexamita inflata]|uniref:Hypothetical_protein n=1 Tax=Hexamita inflata TaxID=28002 RepID=A0AA86U417_9EUKA|nr:Hypothetical protein HINF_LOCUS27476 [Hexamita inflata]CAI9939834.1 Hypothetical protein HINF_LOCUS27479 [Hexamita inflata]CAI9947746.1 Hypothetical protein HINF_LOCUS35391 [Hexamita inflata]